MELSIVLSMAVLLLVVCYLLRKRLYAEREKRVQALFYDISVLFMDMRDKRQNQNCGQLVELLGRYLKAEQIVLRLNKKNSSAEQEIYSWKNTEYKTLRYIKPELVIELKTEENIIGEININGNKALKLLKKEKKKFASFVSKLLGRFDYEDDLYFMAYYDQLTKLPNRAYLLKMADRANEESREKKEMVAYLFFDLDAFKAINDTMGHKSGDELLKAVAARLCKDENKFSMAARYGGDEYLVMLKHVTEMEQVTGAAETLMGLFKDPFMISGRGVSITASIGISLYPCHGSNINELLINADKAMYRSKIRGKNQYDIVPISIGYP